MSQARALPYPRLYTEADDRLLREAHAARIRAEAALARAERQRDRYQGERDAAGWGV